MSPYALLFLVAGAALMRQVIVGRVRETPDDFRDAATALLAGDTAALNTVMARRGSNTDGAGGSGVDGSSDNPAPSLSPSGFTAVAAEAVKLGKAAKGYVLGATGPTYYDCSGLVWRACVNVGVYKGPRFTTATFNDIAPRFCYRIGGPAPGAIVNWEAGGHMGVMISDTEFYSARSPSKGIGSAPISADIKWFGAKPDYWSVGHAPDQTPTHGGVQNG